jgi:hypothetical protein
LPRSPTKLCHKELSPAAKRGSHFIATAFGIDTKEGGELQFLIAERLVYLREHRELLSEFCTGIEKALIPLENLGRQTPTGQQEEVMNESKHTGLDTADITGLSLLYRGDRSTVRRNLRERVTSGANLSDFRFPGVAGR